MPQNRLTGLSPKSKISRQRNSKFTRNSVVKMLAVMEAAQASGPSKASDTTAATPEDDGRPQDFLQSGRTGRRNALANILGEHAVVTSSDLPSQLEALTTKDKTDNNEASTSKS